MHCIRICFMLKRPILKMGMLSTGQWSIGICRSLQPIQCPIECYECIRTQGFPLHQTERDLYAMVCENNTERGNCMTMMAITSDLPMPNPLDIYIVFHLCSISLCLVIDKRKHITWK